MPTFALLIWPFVAMGVFAALGLQRGLIWTTVIGYLFLPDGFFLDLAGLPSYTKYEAIALGALFGCFLTRPRAVSPRQEVAPVPASDPAVVRLLWAVMALLFVGPVFTMLFNSRPYFVGPTMLQGISVGDVRGQIIQMLFFMIVFFLGQRHLNTPKAHQELLRAMVFLGLAYSLLVLFEMRMSPQLNNIIYGYFPHLWGQHLRGGGYRAIVFLDHGLSVGFFMTTAVLAGAAMIRGSFKEKRAFYIVAFIWMFAVLAISRNLGAFALVLLFAPALLLLTPRMQVRIAAIVAVLFLINPLARDVYVQPLLSTAQVISQDRWGSLKTRFENEQALLDHAEEKPLFGWGPRSRWRIHDETGRDVTISDGTWIIVLGKWGWVGFVGFFGVLILPILLLRRVLKRRELTFATSGFAIITAANLIYLIPNSTLSPIGWLMAGALAGFVRYVPARPEADASERPDEDPAPDAPRPKSVYTRFPADQQKRPSTASSRLRQKSAAQVTHRARSGAGRQSSRSSKK